MKHQGLPASITAALLIGFVQTCLLILCWAYIPIYTPLPQWLIGQGLTGAPLRGLLFTTDFMASVILCLPAAFLICKLRPRKLPLYLALAVLPGFLWQYRYALGDTSGPREWSIYVPGAVSVLFTLPVAAVIVRFFTSRGAPDNSFKPKPLRGSA